MDNKNNPAPIAGLGEQLREILKLEPHRRYRALMETPNTAELARLMPPQELWLAIKTVGEEDAMELFELTADEQLIFFQDIDCWRGDELDDRRLLAWFEKLLLCGQSKAAQWLRTVDAEMFVSAMSRFMKVTKPEQDTDPEHIEGFLPRLTIDNVYYLHFSDERAQNAIAPILSFFAHLKFELYARMMEAMMWEAGVETYELTRRWRAGRLRDLGIPDLDEAVEIYKYVDKQVFEGLPEKAEPAIFSPHEAPTMFPIAQMGGDSLLARALRLVPEGEQLDGIACELTHLANRVVIADGVGISEPAQLTQAIAKVGATVSMGLELLSGDDVATAAQSLQRRWLTHIFQLGYSEVLKLARHAHRLFKTGWLARIPEAKMFLGQPLEDILDGLHRPRPLWAANEGGLRFFESLEEIGRAEETFQKIEYYGDLFFDRLRLLSPDPKDWAWEGVNPVELDFKTLFRAALANAAVGKGFHPYALEKADVAAFIESAFEKRGETEAALNAPRKIKREVKKMLAEFMASCKAAQNEREQRFLDELIDEALEFIEAELGRLNMDTLDARYIQGLFIKVR